jgi:Outer membrane protein beta-barrel domain
MREEEFEKRVRDKMKRLGFDPSESVWIGVDKEINKEKKRRVPLFWLFFASGLLLAGGAYYFVTNKNNEGVILNNNAENTIAKISEQRTSNKKQIEQPVIQSTELQKNNNEKNLGVPDNKKRHFTGTSLINRKRVDKTTATTPGKKYAHNEVAAKTKEIKKAKEINETGQGIAATGTADIVISNYNSKSAKSETEIDNKKAADSTVAKMITGEKENKSKKDSVISSATAKNKEKKTKVSSWKWGVTGGVGSSNLNQDLFNSVKTLAAVTLSTNTTTVNNAGNSNSSSEINPGFSFQAGAFVSRNISKRFSFSAGVNYHYYSTTMRTGMKLNTTLVTTNSFNQIITANSYYENTQTRTFTNQYHMIEIPLSVNFQLNKSKRMPFIWELGLTPGYIISSNALYYDPNTNVYFSNYLQPNKMQLNGVTALMFGFPMHKNEWQIGPQLQYGFTGFVNTKDGNPGHLFYAGLKISFIPGKK